MNRVNPQKPIIIILEIKSGKSTIRIKTTIKTKVAKPIRSLFLFFNQYIVLLVPSLDIN